MAGSSLHLAVLAFSAFFIVTFVRLDRRWGIRKGLACVVLAFCAVMQAWLLLPDHFDPRVALPLHVCDLANVVGAAALLWRWRWARTVIVFWGIGLTTHGFITPVVTSPPTTPMFWFFWLNHIFVLTMAVDEVVVGGYRPGRRDVATAIALTAVYAGAMFVLDVATGWNYGFVGPDRPDAQPTAVDLLGPWPLRVLWMALATAAVFVALGWALAKLPGGAKPAAAKLWRG